MEALRALAAKKAQEVQELTAAAAGKPLLSKAELEEAKLKKIREEEAREREEKVSAASPSMLTSFALFCALGRVLFCWGCCPDYLYLAPGPCNRKRNAKSRK